MSLFYSGDPDFPESFLQNVKVEPNSTTNISGLGRGSYLGKRPGRNPGIMASNPSEVLPHRSFSRKEVNGFSDHSETKLDSKIETRLEEDFKSYPSSYRTFPQNDQQKRTPEQSFQNKQQGFEQAKFHSQSRRSKSETTSELGRSSPAQSFRPNLVSMESSSCDLSPAFVTELCSPTQTIPMRNVKESNLRPIETSINRDPGHSARLVVGLGRARLIQIVQEKRMNSSK